MTIMKMPKGRSTIRKGGSLTGTHGPVSTPIRLWSFDAPPNTTLARLEADYMAGLDVVDRVEARSKSSAECGKFTTEGVKDDVLRFALDNLIPSLHKARQSIAKAKAEAADRKAKLALKTADPTDVAGAMRLQEIRTFVRHLDDDKREAWFRDRGDTIPAEVKRAVVEMPPELSGVAKSRHDLLTQDAWQVQHGPELAEIADLDNAVEAAESAVEAARDEVRKECGIADIARFNELAAAVEAKHAAPWLRRRNGTARNRLTS